MLRLLIAPREMRLLLKHGEDVIEDELWKTDRKISVTEARELARVIFDDVYDYANYSVHGHGE